MEGENIGYFLIVEFNSSEATVLNEVLSVFEKYSGMKEYKSISPEEISFHSLVLLPDQHRVLIGKIEIGFTHSEFETLLFLTRHPKQVFTKRQIYEAVWDDIPVSVDAKVECMIYSIRKKLRTYTDRKYIRTVWGVGYKFDPGT